MTFADWVEENLMRDLFILGYTSEQIGEMTIFDAVNLIDAYVWKQQQYQNNLAQFITLPIWNSAGKYTKKAITMRDIFTDNRFAKADDEEIASIAKSLREVK